MKQGRQKRLIKEGWLKVLQGLPSGCTEFAKVIREILNEKK